MGGRKEAVMCRVCHAIYHHKRWYQEGKIILSKAQKTKVEMIICPACRKIQDRFPGGVITLTGDFLKSHKDQILHLVRHQETRAKGINPLERIIVIKDRRDRVEIQTTNERLAQRIGREIQRAYKGDAKYHWSRDDKFIRVDWHRDASRD